MNTYIMPTRLVLFENAENTEELFFEKPLQANFNFDDCTLLKKGGFLLLDFGRELRGGAAICVQATSKDRAMCRIVFGESVSEAMSEIGEKGATNNHSVRDMTVEIPSMSVSCIGSTGFRFLKIEALDSDISIKNIKAKSEIKDITYKGSFECDDELLNEIWKVGAYTVHLNMGEYVWDGVKRDRLVWIGDMNPEIATINAVFGYDESVPNSLDLAKTSTAPDEWINNIATYSMWWIINHYEWYMKHGDKEYLKKQLAYTENICTNAAKLFDSGFKKSENSMEYFVDWSNKDTENEIEGVKSIFYFGFSCAKKIFEEFGMTQNAEFCRNYSEKLKNDISDTQPGKLIASLNILAGRNTEVSKAALSGNSAKDMSCFLGYYVLLAKAKLGELDDAFDIIREFWGGMLKMGATSFWEDFDINWAENSCRIDEPVRDGMRDIHGDFGKYCYKQFRHSLCHGWASGPTSFLSEYVAGIEVLEAGFKKIKFTPRLGRLNYIRASYPTPYGEIHVEHRKKDGKIVTTYTVPKEIEVVGE